MPLATARGGWATGSLTSAVRWLRHGTPGGGPWSQARDFARLAESAGLPKRHRSPDQSGGGRGAERGGGETIQVKAGASCRRLFAPLKDVATASKTSATKERNGPGRKRSGFPCAPVGKQEKVAGRNTAGATSGAEETTNLAFNF
ncbi:hypothetical protein MRX96_025176 [Rhipicephalus microplus]